MDGGDLTSSSAAMELLPQFSILLEAAWCEPLEKQYATVTLRVQNVSMLK
jgi:hypothetical protein